MAASHLQEKFGKDHHVKVEEGEGHLPKVVLQSNAGAKAEVYLNGGHLSSFKKSDGEELIFMSSKAIFQHGKPIRGGNRVFGLSYL
jgi:D-hexose-6-phosphate mutarotase